MQTEGPRPDNPERPLFFTDAVVAIALTLLVLPLLEGVPKDIPGDLRASQWLGEHWAQIISFVASFAVLASFWVTHNRVMTYVARFPGPLMVLNLLWMALVVFLQIPSALMYETVTDRGILGLYIGTMTATSFVMSLMAALIWRHPEWQVVPGSFGWERASVSWVVSGLYVCAMAIAMIIPSLGLSPSFGFFSLAVLAFVGPIHSMVVRLVRRRQQLTADA